MHRTSFGVAGLDAAQRFDAGPAALSGFVVLQLLVYAALQVPVGLLLDRFGGRSAGGRGRADDGRGPARARRWPTTLPLAVAARVLVGAGDALTFISVLSVVTAWFPAAAGAADDAAHRAGRAARAGALGGAARGAAARPGLDARVPVCGGRWGCSLGLAVLVVVRDRPPGAPPPPPAASPREVLRGLRTSWARAGHPARALDAHGHPVLRHGVRPAVGRAVPGGRAGDDLTGRRARCSRCSWWSGSSRARCSASSPRATRCAARTSC